MQAVLYLIAVILLGIASVMHFMARAWPSAFVVGAGCLALLAYAWPVLSTLGD
jgi:hypothetical protein